MHTLRKPLWDSHAIFKASCNLGSYFELERILHLPQASGMGHGIQNSKNTTCNPRFLYIVPNQNALVLG